MKIPARCVHCGEGFLLDRAFVGSALPCPTCGTADGLRVGARSGVPRPVDDAAAPQPQRTLLPAASTATATRVRTQAKPETAEVVCPRCKLHFVPRGAARDETERRTVLVVEDMDYFREAVAEALAGRFEVRTAVNVEEARAALTAGGVDLMILDLTLGGAQQGLDLLRGLAAKPCPIIVFTEQDESEMSRESWGALQRLGADDMVTKGMNVGDSLLRKVGTLLGEEPDEDD